MEKDRRYWILGFGAVAVAVIFWLSPRPEEKKEEETASAPAEETLVEEAPKPIEEAAEEPVQVTPTPEEFEEASRRARWEANFPYKPTYHPTLKFDTESRPEPVAANTAVRDRNTSCQPLYLNR